jgi:regulator of chromosome condensation
VPFTAAQLEDESLVRYDEYNKPRICLKPLLLSLQGVESVRFVACGTDHTIFITDKGAAYATGFNSQGQLGLGDDNDDVQVARRVTSKAVNETNVVWAGAGGQCSMVAGRSRRAANNADRSMMD